MGVDPYLIAPTLTLCIAQRLVRTTCDASRQPAANQDALKEMADNVVSPQARSGQRRASSSVSSQFVPAASADGTPESAAYEELLTKLATSHSPQESPQAREIVKGQEREIVPGKGEAS